MLNFLPVITRCLLIAVLVGIVAELHAQGALPPQVPDKIKAPAGEVVFLQVHASGKQIYTCQLAADGMFAWILKAPEAQLYDQQGTVIGRHYAGPTWSDTDGSEVVGKPVSRVDSPDSDSIPWLLVAATAHSGNGVLNRVTSIQRIHTKGGLPPAAADCNASKRNVEARIDYTADYYFYSSTK